MYPHVGVAGNRGGLTTASCGPPCLGDCAGDVTSAVHVRNQFEASQARERSSMAVTFVRPNGSLAGVATKCVLGITGAVGIS